MLTPDEYAAIPDAAIELMNKLEDAILRDIARRIKTAGTMTNSAEWQMIRLQELGMSTDTIQAEIRKTIGLSRDAVEQLFYKAAERSMRFDAEIMTKAGFAPRHPLDNAFLEQMVHAAKEQAGSELENITRSMGFVTPDGRFKPAQVAYQNAMDFTQFQVASGAMTADSAIMGAIKSLADSGLRVVNYASGARNHIEVAARRAVITGVGQVVGKISEANADALGTNYVEVTAHAGARPEHAAWQGKVYCRVGSEPGYPNLVEATGYGTVGGLKGANCRHDFFPFIPGVSQRAYTDEQLKSIDPAPIQYNGRWYTYYEATQRQRQIESAMRKSKRRCIAYDAAGLKGDYTAEAARLRSLRAVYADFSKRAGLVTQNQRARVAGFGRSAAGKARTAAKTEIEKYSAVRYNKDGTIVVTDDWTGKKHVSAPPWYKPNAVVDTLSRNGKQHDRTIYGPDARFLRQIHGGDHGHPKQHQYGKHGEHVHDFIWASEGEKPERIPREATEAERTKNADILGGADDDG